MPGLVLGSHVPHTLLLVVMVGERHWARVESVSMTINTILYNYNRYNDDR